MSEYINKKLLSNFKIFECIQDSSSLLFNIKFKFKMAKLIKIPPLVCITLFYLLEEVLAQTNLFITPQNAPTSCPTGQ